MPCERARRAAEAPRSAGTMGKTGEAVVHLEDCEHHRQSSAHLPDFALTMVPEVEDGRGAAARDEMRGLSERVEVGKVFEKGEFVARGNVPAEGALDKEAEHGG